MRYHVAGEVETEQIRQRREQTGGYSLEAIVAKIQQFQIRLNAEHPDRQILQLVFVDAQTLDV